jgi:hypothetical protein
VNLTAHAPVQVLTPARQTLPHNKAVWPGKIRSRVGATLPFSYLTAATTHLGGFLPGQVAISQPDAIRTMPFAVIVPSPQRGAKRVLF